jgi:murein DD-endopeptidase MepM/ murein hydrolase activator NlpD
MRLKLKRSNQFKLRLLEVYREKGKWFVLLGSVFIGIFILIYFFLLPLKPIPTSMGVIESNRSPTKETSVQEPPHQVIEGQIKEKSTLSQSLAENHIPSRWIELIISKLKPLVNFKKLKGGTYRFFIDIKGEFIKFIFEVGPTEVYEVEKGQQGYSAQKKGVSLETFLVKVMGEIRSSLFEAMDAIGEQDQLVIYFAEILASEIDFYKDVKEGDRFQVVVEKIFKGKEFIKYGLIHALEYRRGEKVIRGIHFQGDYYNEKGISLRKAFLKVPLRFNRISSKFSRARRHPILGGILPHFGVDYAAPQGTLVWAVADGTIVSCGWGEGFGKQVILRHPNGYMTYYGHLSNFGPGIRSGRRVKQKQIIGYVGTTGLSTGPHLDYRLAKDGRFRNPLKEVFPTGLPIEKGKMEAFQKRRDEMVAWFQFSSI